MTTTLSDRQAHIEGIRANQDDDLPRLVFADWLEEQPRAKACGACVRGFVRVNTHHGPDYEGCGRCDGTGSVSTGDAERAELIRVQVALASEIVPEGWEDIEEVLKRREQELWAGDGVDRWFLPHMAGWGLQLDGPLHDDHTALVRRGFVHTLRGPLAAFWEGRECGECQGRGGFGGYDGDDPPMECPRCSSGRVSGPTAAFRELVRLEPVARVEVTDRDAEGHIEGWSWFATGTPGADQRSLLPAELYRHICETFPNCHRSDGLLGARFFVEADARTALSAALTAAVLKPG